MARIVKEGRPFERRVVSRERGRRDLPDAQARRSSSSASRTSPRASEITLFRHGEFVDLCRGPHVQRTDQIGAFKLLDTSGAYFKGDERNEMLQRIYGTAFATQGGARRLLREDRGGAPPRPPPARARSSTSSRSRRSRRPRRSSTRKGAIVYNELRRASCAALYRKYGYQEVITPQLFDVELWKTSGHYDALQREHVLRRGGRARVRPQADELPVALRA